MSWSLGLPEGCLGGFPKAGQGGNLQDPCTLWPRGPVLSKGVEGEATRPRDPRSTQPPGYRPFLKHSILPQPTLVACPAPFLTRSLLVTSPILSFRPPRIKPGQSLALCPWANHLSSGPVHMCEMRRGTILAYRAVGRGQEDDICEIFNVGPAHGKGPTHTPSGASPFILAKFIRCGLFPSLEEVPERHTVWERNTSAGSGMRIHEFPRGFRQPSPPCLPFMRPEMPGSPGQAGAQSIHTCIPPASANPGLMPHPALGTLTSLHLSLSQGRGPAESPGGREAMNLINPFSSRATASPGRRQQQQPSRRRAAAIRREQSGGNSSFPAARPETSPSSQLSGCSRLPGGGAGCLRSLGHTCSDQGHADPRAPGAPLQEEKAVATEGRVRRVGEGAGPGYGLDAVEAGSQGQLGVAGRQGQDGKWGQDGRSSYMPESHPGVHRRDAGGQRRGLAAAEGRDSWEAARRGPCGRPVSAPRYTHLPAPPFHNPSKGSLKLLGK